MQDFTSATLNGGCVTLHADQGASWAVANLWLRDNCRCPSCRHPGNGQKLYGIADLPAELAAREASFADDRSLRVVWSDGHQSSYAAQWLASHDLSAPARRARSGGVKLWRIFRLNPGDCVVMQNDRTLHGRTAFDPDLGRRHLQGCYIDGDAMESRRQVLRRAAASSPTQ